MLKDWSSVGTKLDNYKNILVFVGLFVLGSAFDELSAREVLESFGPAVTDAGNTTLSDDDFELNNFILYEEEPESVFNKNEGRSDEAGQSDTFERNGQSQDNHQGTYTYYKYDPFKSESFESEQKQRENMSSDYFESLTIDPGVYTSENNLDKNIFEDSTIIGYRSNEKKIKKAQHQERNDLVKMNKEAGTNFNNENTISSKVSISNKADKERNLEENEKYNTKTNSENSDFAIGEEGTIKKVVRKKPRKLKYKQKDKIYLANLDVPESADSVSTFFENEEGKKLMCAKTDQLEKMSTDEDIDSLESELKDTATEIEYLNNRLHEQKMNSYSWEDIVKEAPKHSEKHSHHYPTQECRKKVISNLKYILSSDDKNDRDYVDDGSISRVRNHERNEEKLTDQNNNMIHQRRKLKEIKRKKMRKFDRGSDDERLNRYIYEKAQKERLASRIGNDIKKELYNKYKEMETDNGDDEELLEKKFKKIKRIKNMEKNCKIIPKRRHKTPNSYSNTETDYEEEKGSMPKSLIALGKQFSNRPIEFSIQYDGQSKWSPEGEEEDDDYGDEYGADEELEGDYGSIFLKKQKETPYDPDIQSVMGDKSNVQNIGESEVEQDGAETESPYTWEVPAVETHSSVKKDKPRRKIKSIGGRRQLGSQILVGPLVKKVHFKREIIQPQDHICEAYRTFLSDVDMFKTVYNKVRKPYFSPPATDNQIIDCNKQV